MIGRIVEVADDRRHLFVSRGFMVVQDTEGERKGLCPSPVAASPRLPMFQSVLGEVAAQLPLVFALHPRTRNNIERFGLSGLIDTRRTALLPPWTHWWDSRWGAPRWSSAAEDSQQGRKRLRPYLRQGHHLRQTNSRWSSSP